VFPLKHQRLGVACVFVTWARTVYDETGIAISGSTSAVWNLPERRKNIAHHLLWRQGPGWWRAISRSVASSTRVPQQQRSI